MLYGHVPGLGKPLSRLVQGTMMLSVENRDACFALLDAVFEQGCTTFDTAHVYGGGDCERVLGEWIQLRGLRKKIVIIAKGAHFNADRDRVTPFDIAADLHDSLARLKTDYVDLYLLHRDDPSVPVGPIVETLNEYRHAGRIRAFGASNWTHERIAKANAYAARRNLLGFAASSPHYSLGVMVKPIWPGCVSITGAHNEPARQWYLANAMPLFCWSSLSRGLFSGRFTSAQIRALPEDNTGLAVRAWRSRDNLRRLDRASALALKRHVSVAQIALAYLLRQPLNCYALVGSATPEECRANAAALNLVLNPDELEWLDLKRPRLSAG